MGINYFVIIFSVGCLLPGLILSDPSLTIIQPQHSIFLENQPIIVECSFDASNALVGFLKGKFLQNLPDQLMAACNQKSTLLQLSITCVNQNNQRWSSCYRNDGFRFCRYLIQSISGDARGLEIFCRDDTQADSQSIVFNIIGKLSPH